MPGIFADAVYFIALLVPRDRLHQAAIDASKLVEGQPIVTTRAVIFEVFDHMSGLGPSARTAAVELDERLQERATVIDLTPELLAEAVELYSSRPDKGYSLTDCLSMAVCRRMKLTEVLSHDHHFEQEGFSILL